MTRIVFSLAPGGISLHHGTRLTHAKTSTKVLLPLDHVGVSLASNVLCQERRWLL
jgi:hypothetical protein